MTHLSILMPYRKSQVTKIANVEACAIFGRVTPQSPERNMIVSMM